MQSPKGRCPECGVSVRTSILDWLNRNRWSSAQLIELRNRIFTLAMCPLLLLAAGLGLLVWLIVSLKVTRQVADASLIQRTTATGISVLSYGSLLLLVLWLGSWALPLDSRLNYRIGYWAWYIFVGGVLLQMVLIQAVGARLTQWVEGDSFARLTMCGMMAIAGVFLIFHMVLNVPLEALTTWIPLETLRWLSDQSWLMVPLVFFLMICHLVAWSLLCEDLRKVPPRPESSEHEISLAPQADRV